MPHVPPPDVPIPRPTPSKPSLVPVGGIPEMKPIIRPVPVERAPAYDPGLLLPPDVKDVDLMIPCPLCDGFKASSVLGIVSHFMEEHPNTRHRCSRCGKVFGSREQLKRHEREVHNHHREYTCSHCGKSFARRERLIVHERIHTGERPFACLDSGCGSKFKKKEHLFSHIRHVHRTEADPDSSQLIRDAKSYYARKV